MASDRVVAVAAASGTESDLGDETIMSEIVPALDARRGADEWLDPDSLTETLADALTDEFPSPDQRASWAVFLLGLETAHRLSFVPVGEKLEKGRVYIDLRQPCRGPFRALQGQTAGSRNRFLAQEDVPAHVWFAIIEHCACVDAETGMLGATHHIPCNRLGTVSLGLGMGLPGGFVA